MAVNRLSDQAQSLLRQAESLDVLALVPICVPVGTDIPVLPSERFHQYPVLGTAVIARRESQVEVYESSIRGVEENKALAANCFLPRHGIRGVGPEGTVDLVICFECSQLYVYMGEAKPEWLLISASPKAVLDRVLSDSGVPLLFDQGLNIEAAVALERVRAESEKAQDVERAKAVVGAPTIDPEKPRHAQFFPFVCPFCKHAEEIGLWFNYKTCEKCGRSSRIVRQAR